MKYYCDSTRHLVCVPYSVANLHQMAADLGIARAWFHGDHYDIPKKRVAEITAMCTLVSPREIMMIARRGWVPEKEDKMAEYKDIHAAGPGQELPMSEKANPPMDMYSLPFHVKHDEEMDVWDIFDKYGRQIDGGYGSKADAESVMRDHERAAQQGKTKGINWERPTFVVRGSDLAALEAAAADAGAKVKVGDGFPDGSHIVTVSGGDETKRRAVVGRFAEKRARKKYEDSDVRTAHARLLKWDDERKAADFVITTGDLDRDGETVDPHGIDLENYKLNPVVCLNHDTDELPVGKSEDPETGELTVYKTEVDGEPALVARVFFDWGDARARRVGGQVQRNFLRTASVSFLPKEGETSKNSGGGNHYGQSELLEWSVTTVPANARASRSVSLMLKKLGMNSHVKNTGGYIECTNCGYSKFGYVGENTPQGSDGKLYCLDCGHEAPPGIKRPGRTVDKSGRTTGRQTPETPYGVKWTAPDVRGQPSPNNGQKWFADKKERDSFETHLMGDSGIKNVEAIDPPKAKGYKLVTALRAGDVVIESGKQKVVESIQCTTPYACTVIFVGENVPGKVHAMSVYERNVRVRVKALRMGHYEVQEQEGRWFVIDTRDRKIEAGPFTSQHEAEQELEAMADQATYNKSKSGPRRGAGMKRKVWVKNKSAWLLKSEGEELDPVTEQYLEERGLDDVRIEDEPPKKGEGWEEEKGPGGTKLAQEIKDGEEFWSKNGEYAYAQGNAKVDGDTVKITDGGTGKVHTFPVGTKVRWSKSKAVVPLDQPMANDTGETDPKGKVLDQPMANDTGEVDPKALKIVQRAKELADEGIDEDKAIDDAIEEASSDAPAALKGFVKRLLKAREGTESPVDADEPGIPNNTGPARSPVDADEPGIVGGDTYPENPVDAKSAHYKDAMADCVGRKVPIFVKEHPDWTQDHAVAAAYGYCGEKAADMGTSKKWLEKVKAEVCAKVLKSIKKNSTGVEGAAEVRSGMRAYSMAMKALKAAQQETEQPHMSDALARAVDLLDKAKSKAYPEEDAKRKEKPAEEKPEEKVYAGKKLGIAGTVGAFWVTVDGVKEDGPFVTLPEAKARMAEMSQSKSVKKDAADYAVEQDPETGKWCVYDPDGDTWVEVDGVDEWDSEEEARAAIGAAKSKVLDQPMANDTGEVDPRGKRAKSLSKRAKSVVKDAADYLEDAAGAESTPKRLKSGMLYHARSLKELHDEDEQKAKASDEEVPAEAEEVMHRLGKKLDGAQKGLDDTIFHVTGKRLWN